MQDIPHLQCPVIHTVKAKGRSGDFVAFPMNGGWILAIAIGEENGRVIVSWGDFVITIPPGASFVSSKEIFDPSAIEIVGRRFDSFEAAKVEAYKYLKK